MRVAILVRAMSTLAIALFLLLPSRSVQVRPYVQVDDPVVALEHARVIDGTGAPARDDQTIVIEGGKIRSVGDSKTAEVPKDARRVDLAGKSVFPGLVGMHDHRFYPTSRGVFA